MAEPSSLFAKIHITKNNFESFLKSQPTKPELDSDWIEWWDSRGMYKKKKLHEIDIYWYNEPTNEEIINHWIERKQTISFSDYDFENEIWNFGIIEFSENYMDMIPCLAFIKSISKYKNNNSDDFVVVYDYLWGEKGVSAYLTFENQKSLFDNKILNKTDINSDVLKYVEDYFLKQLK